MKCQLKLTGPLLWSSVEWGKGKLGVILYSSQNVFELILKKKLLHLITKLVVTLNHLGVIHLWRPQNMTNCVTPNPLHLQKEKEKIFCWKKICKHLTNFKTIPPHFYEDDINVWSLTSWLWYEFFFHFRKNYHPVVWTTQANHQNIA